MYGVIPCQCHISYQSFVQCKYKIQSDKNFTYKSKMPWSWVFLKVNYIFILKIILQQVTAFQTEAFFCTNSLNSGRLRIHWDYGVEGFKMWLDLPLKTPDEVHLVSLIEAKGNLFSSLIFERFSLTPLSLEIKQCKRLGHL